MSRASPPASKAAAAAPAPSPKVVEQDGDETLQLLDGNEEASQWASSEAQILEGLLSGGVDQWASMETILLEAQDRMQHSLAAGEALNDKDKQLGQFLQTFVEKNNGSTSEPFDPSKWDYVDSAEQSEAEAGLDGADAGPDYQPVAGPEPRSAAAEWQAQPDDGDAPEKWKAMIEQLRKDLERVSQELSKVQEEKMEMQAELNSHRALVKKAETDMLTMAKKLKEQKDMLVEKQTEFHTKEAQLLKESRQLGIKVSELEKEKKKLQAETQLHLEQYELVRFQMDEKLAQQEEDFKSRIAELEQICGILEGGATGDRINSLIAELNKRSKETERLIQEHQSQKEQIATLTDEKSTLELQAASLRMMAEEARAALEMRLDAALSQVVDSNGRPLDRATIESVKNIVNAETQRFATMSSEKMAEIDELRKKHAEGKTALQQRLAKFGQNVKEVASAGRTLEDARARLKLDSANTTAAEEEVGSQLKTLQQTIAELNHQLHTVQTTKSAVDEDRIRIQQERDQLVALLATSGLTLPGTLGKAAGSDEGMVQKPIPAGDVPKEGRGCCSTDGKCTIM